MKKFNKLLALIFFFVVVAFGLNLKPLSVQAAQPKVTLVYGNEKIKDKDAFVISIMAEGYKKNEQKQFIEQCKTFAGEFVKVSPWDEMKSAVKIYAIGTVSKQSGCVGDEAYTEKEAKKDKRNTYFGARFWTSGLERFLTISDFEKPNKLISKYKPQTDAKMILVNAEKYGGSGGPLAVVSSNYLSAEIAYHELAHTIAGLADEYYYSTYEAPNLTHESSKKKVKWKKFLGKNGVGMYKYEGTNDWYVPSEECKMKSLEYDFCEVCKEELRKSICDGSNVSIIYFQPYAQKIRLQKGKLDLSKYLILRKGSKKLSGSKVKKLISITYYDKKGKKLSKAPNKPGTYRAKVTYKGNKTISKCKCQFTFKICK